MTLNLDPNITLIPKWPYYDYTLTVDEVAERLRVTNERVRDMILDRLLDVSNRKCRRKWRVKESEVARLLTQERALVQAMAENTENSAANEGAFEAWLADDSL